ncbi:MAG: haloacid dehalogenase, type [Frankiales bacterium]|nr:haloacid dehalogenase, type [Frankiales bacterium]
MLVLLDAMGTLFSLRKVREVFAATGCPDGTLEHWFSRTLHCAATLALTGAHAPFPAVARSALAHVLVARQLPGIALEPALAALRELDAKAGALDCVTGLHAAGHRVAVLTNGTAEATRGLLDRTGLPIADVVSVDEVGAYKPARAPYEHAVARLGGIPETTVLVAAHAWDVLGAHAAGLRTVWVGDVEVRWPFPGDGPPDRSAPDLAAIPALLR